MVEAHYAFTFDFVAREVLPALKARAAAGANGGASRSLVDEIARAEACLRALRASEHRPHDSRSIGPIGTDVDAPSGTLAPMTVQEIAKRLGITDRAVLKRAKRGNLTTYIEGGRRMFPAEVAADLIAERAIS